MNGSDAIGLEPFDGLDAVQLRHHDIEQDEIGQQLADLLQRLDPVRRGRHLVALGLEPHLQDVDIVRDIVDDQDQRRLTHRPPIRKHFNAVVAEDRAVDAVDQRPLTSLTMPSRMRATLKFNR